MSDLNEEYDFFMVFELLDSGEKQRIDVDESDLQSILAPEQVFVIVKEDVRRIFIWKGVKSPVRKRFISSRVASSLQEELQKEAAFHRCKIVSVDQGDEPVEFLSTFNLESMEVKERPQDMRYIRNIEKDTTRPKGKVVEDTGSESEKEEEYYSPALEELKRKGVDISAEIEKPTGSPSSTSASVSRAKKPYSPPRGRSSSRAKSKKHLDAKQIIEKILEQDLPENYGIQNLLVGKTLYGAISKITNVFGEDIEEQEWERISKLPDGIYSLKNYIFRIYLDKDAGMVEGIEILKSEGSSTPSKMEKSTINLPDEGGTIFDKILNVEIPEGYRRENLIVGHKLYGAISKKVEVFGEEQIETDWNLVEKVPKEIIVLDTHLFRLYFNQKNETIDAVEILQKGSEKIKENPNTESSQNKEEKPKTKNKRNLHKIPSAD
ncbi:MAG: hypothetical protein BAJALOKI3v1_190035 [Promethearchaeota archaeon]|nr:MAG: hypothetical protein BAJALOKI3v1_190035 [Candidatus Lokiarchaeota archaeon]